MIGSACISGFLQKSAQLYKKDCRFFIFSQLFPVRPNMAAVV